MILSSLLTAVSIAVIPNSSYTIHFNNYLNELNLPQDFVEYINSENISVDFVLSSDETTQNINVEAFNNGVSVSNSSIRSDYFYLALFEPDSLENNDFNLNFNSYTNDGVTEISFNLYWFFSTTTDGDEDTCFYSFETDNVFTGEEVNELYSLNDDLALMNALRTTFFVSDNTITSSIFDTIGDIITGYVGSITEMFNDLMLLFYADNKLTYLSQLLLVGIGIGITKWGMNFFKDSVRL